MVNDEFIAPQCPRIVGLCGPGLWNKLIAHTLHLRVELKCLHFRLRLFVASYKVQFEGSLSY